jgi:hypothetical protein
MTIFSGQSALGSAIVVSGAAVEAAVVGAEVSFAELSSLPQAATIEIAATPIAIADQRRVIFEIRILPPRYVIGLITMFTSVGN